MMLMSLFSDSAPALCSHMQQRSDFEEAAAALAPDKQMVWVLVWYCNNVLLYIKAQDEVLNGDDGFQSWLEV